MNENWRLKNPNRLFGLLLLLDALLKRWSFVGGKYVWNEGVAFGVFLGHWSDLVIVLAMIALGWWWMMLKKADWGERLLIVGGLGNLIDRLVYGQVVDWFRLPGLGLWINLADLYITLGLGIILVDSFRNNNKNGNSIRG